MYSEDSAAQCLFELQAQQSFDVMLFVGKNTLARKNPLVSPVGTEARLPDSVS